ncbi:glycosyltransferase family 4 protein [Pseudarthrobacter enclensis]|uniref:Glycosyltransferase involved in cell wall biosynthesis n=1 Tax=Pseudarthrobacter enclensis TaxID=993070 RepID=A0ABT9RVU4_9MICC|nr:glycosyltransferase family 4 protein [Pseudarthrobacter enclensis]MDP9889355.1 glycosyltransferase involved in cell wall biosynthesis [Pseudarthrobacter enclensis]
MGPIRLLVPGNIRHSSGGNVYNARLVAGLQALGADVDVVAVEGSWPDAGAGERRRFGALLGTGEPAAGPGQAVVLVDGLVAVGAPDELELAATAGRQAWVLIHMPVPESAGRAALESEARALRAAAGVICTSTWAATRLAERGLPQPAVTLPGVDPAPQATGSKPPHLLVVAALLPNKDQLLAVEGLAHVRDLPWTASFVGSDQADPDYAREVRGAITASGLGERVLLTGELAGAALEAEWARTDLSLLVSRHEAFGMAVTESVAHGIPVLVRGGTGAVEALGLGTLATDDGDPRLPGAALPLPEGGQESPGRLGRVLRQWLEDPETRENWRAAVRDARTRLPDWSRTAEEVLALLAPKG